jgi:ureidoglycolate dehydrogenase (NAD+)
MTGPTIPADRLRRFTAQVFARAGLEAADAARVADALVWADLRGQAAHGVSRIPLYLANLENGHMQAKAKPRLDRDEHHAAIMDGGRAMGQVSLTAAMKHSIAMARKYTIGWTWLKNATHTGALGYYAQFALRETMAAMVFNGGQPLMAAHGTAVPALSTNPICFAVPGGPQPLIFDMASSAFSWGQLAEARRRGTPLPEDSVLDDDGRVTTDPAKGNTVLPLAGHKGAGLSFMIECLTSLVVDQPLINEIAHGRPFTHTTSQNALAIAVNISDFIAPKQFAENVAGLIEAVKTQRLRPGFDEVLMPGEGGARRQAQAEEIGIQLAAPTRAMLEETAAGLGIDPPRPDRRPKQR